jgi:Tfp pilus assembly protein PilW
VPASLSADTGTFEVLFRSAQVYAPAHIRVYADGETVKTAKKRIITPGEMERVTFTLTKAASAVTVNVEA